MGSQEIAMIQKLPYLPVAKIMVKSGRMRFGDNGRDSSGYGY
jgi:hypothetical protein